MNEETKVQCTVMLRVVFIAIAFLLLWIRFVAIGGIPSTDNAGQAITGVFTTWVLSQLITTKGFWIELYRWGSLMTSLSILQIITSVDTAKGVSGQPASLDFAIVVNITILATLEILTKWDSIQLTPQPPLRREESAYTANLLENNDAGEHTFNTV